MSPVYIGRKFWQWWVIANTLSLTVSLFSFSVFWEGLNAIRPRLEYNLASSIIYASFALVGVSIGLAQWLVLKRKVPRISGLWILTNIPGLYIGMFIGYVSLFCIGFILNDTGGIFEKQFIWAAVSGSVGGAVGGAMGGLITGISQGLLLVRRVVLTRLWLRWTIINTMAWAFSWSVGWAFGLVLGIKLHTLLPPLYDGISIVVFLIIFGMISSFLNGMITGRVLVRALQRSKIPSSTDISNSI